MDEPHGASVVIITALPLERDAVLRRLPNAERITTKSRVYYRAQLPTIDGHSYDVVLLALSGMGTASAATATIQAIDVWNPQFVFLTGIAGGIQDAVNGSRGDIIVAEQIVGYELAKETDAGSVRRFEGFRPSHELLQKAREFAKQAWFDRIDVPRPDGGSLEHPKVHFGVVASGDKVIANKKFLDELRSSWPRLLGVEMEAVGMAAAAYQSDTAPGILFIKGISDWADRSKDDGWQPYAADVAATFTCAFLESSPFFPKRTRVQALRIHTFHFSGKHKIRLCQRLGDEWYDLADYFDIPSDNRRRFPSGRECQAIWEWLRNRSKLDGLPDALDFIGRTDLADLLKQTL